MSETYSKLEITPKIIDLGTKVVQMRQVASVGYTLIYPLRRIATALFILSACSVIFAGLAAGLPSLGSRDDRLLPLGLAAIAFIGAVVAYQYSVRFVTIATSDGDKLRLASASGEFLMGVMARIRETMTAPHDAPLHTTINITAGTIETNSLVDLTSIRVDQSPGAAVAGRDLTPATNGTALPHAQWPSGPLRNGHGGGVAGTPAGAHPHATTAPPNGYANGSYRPMQTNGRNGARDLHADSRRAAMRTGMAEAAAVLAGTGVGASFGNQVTVSQAPGAVAIGGRAYGASIATRVQGAELQDVEALIGMVTRSGHPHQDALVGLLKVVHDHLATGRAGRDDARAYWQSFADYALKYLTGLEGVVALTERVARVFAR